MRYFDLSSLRDIAAKSSLRESKVKSMLHRLRGKLRLFLQEEGY